MYQTKKQYKFSVCILYLVSILYPVCSLHFALTGLVLLFLFEQQIGEIRRLISVHKGKQTRHAMEIALSRNYVEKNVKLIPTELIPGPLLAENTSFL